jgi:hypothetical protein
MKDGLEHIDDIFRENLSNVQIEPAASVWSGISSKLSWNEFTSLNFTNFSSNIYLMASAGITGIAAAIVSATLMLSPASRPEIPENMSSKQECFIEMEESNPAFETRKTAQPFLNHIDAETSDTKQAENIPQRQLFEGEQLLALKPELFKNSFEAYALRQKTPEKINALGIPHNNDLTDAQGYSFRLFDDYQKTSKYSFVINSGPEFIDVPVDEQLNIRQLNLNAMARYELGGGMYVQGGLGASVMEDQTPYTLDYKSLDSVGFYYDVHYYVPDPSNPDSVILITTIETIYDSVTHNTIAYADNRYTYFRIPLSFGYDVFSYRNFGLSLRAGGEYAVIMSRKEAAADIPSDVRLLYIERRIEEKLECNFRLLFGLTLEYHLNDKLALQLNPTYRYYFRSVYDSPGGNASSLSINGGIRFQF